MPRVASCAAVNVVVPIVNAVSSPPSAVSVRLFAVAAAVSGSVWLPAAAPFVSVTETVGAASVNPLIVIVSVVVVVVPSPSVSVYV